MVKTVQDAYGTPAKQEFKDPVAKEGIVSMHWQAGTMSLMFADRSKEYQCVGMRWADLEMDQAVQAKWPSKAVRGISPLILESISDGSDPVDDEDPVGDILGVGKTPTTKIKKR